MDIKQLQFYVIFLSILLGRVKNYFIHNVNQNLTFTEMFNKIKTKFDIEVYKAQYHRN